MWVVWAVMVPLIASSYLAGYLDRRRRGSTTDWTFIRNPTALAIGAAAAGVIVGPGMTSLRGVLLAIVPALFVTAALALTVHRRGVGRRLP